MPIPNTKIERMNRYMDVRMNVCLLFFNTKNLPNECGPAHR